MGDTGRVADQRTQVPFVELLPALLEERGLSLNATARAAGVSQAFLWSVVNQRAYKTPSPALVAKVACALGLPEDYFAEYRLAWVVERLRGDPDLLDALYDELRT